MTPEDIENEAWNKFVEWKKANPKAFLFPDGLRDRTTEGTYEDGFVHGYKEAYGVARNAGLEAAAGMFPATDHSNPTAERIRALKTEASDG